MTDPVEIARAADVDNAVNQPDEPIMYTGEAFADCVSDLIVPETAKELEELRTDYAFAVWWMEQQGKPHYSKDGAARQVRAAYESVFRVGMKHVMNVMEQGITSTQLGMEE